MAINESQLALLKIQMKRATSTEWNRSEDSGAAWRGYLLRQAEIGVEVFNDNTIKFKIGDGINPWWKLPYASGEVGKFVESLPSLDQAIPNTFYIQGEDLYYTTDNKAWTQIAGGIKEFDELNNRPKYNGTQMTHSTNIPKVPSQANEIGYSKNTSGLIASNVQSAIDELALKQKNSLEKLSTPDILYGNNSTGTLTGYSFSQSKAINTIARRTSTGTLKAQDPIENDDLVTKQYQDNLITPLQRSVESLNTNVESLRGRATNLETAVENNKEGINKNKNDIADLTERVGTNEGDISNLQTNVSTLKTNVTTIQGQISKAESNIENNTNNIKDLKEKLDNEVTERQNNEVTAIDAGLGVNKSTITLTKRDGSQLSTNLTIASNTQNGLMPSSSFAQILQNTEDINNLKNQGGRYIGVSFETYAQLKEYSIPSTTKPGDFTFVLNDEDHEDSTTRYIYNGTEFKFAYVIEYDPVGLATLEKAGIVKSSETEGQVFVEHDGTMSLNGYDKLTADIQNKVDKEEGKGLSSNDFTQEYIDKINILDNKGDGSLYLANDGEYHEIQIPSVKVQDVMVNESSIVDPLGIVNLSPLAETGSWNDMVDIPSDLVRDADYVHTDNNYTTVEKDKVKLLDNSGTGSKVLTDAGIYTRLADVAASGSYTDLVDIPENLVQDADYVHTDNNFTDDLRDRLLEIKDTGEINVIESISLNGNQLPVDETKNVNINLEDYALLENLPTKLSELQNDNYTVQDKDYVHTDNNFTEELEKKLKSLPENGEENVIESVKVDGVPLLVDPADKSVNVVLENLVPYDVYNETVEEVAKNTKNIQALQAAGLWRGLFQTYKDLPTTTPNQAFNGGLVYVNDYVIVEEDETHEGSKTRYMATAVSEDGVITWTFFDKEEGSIATATNTDLGLVKGTASTAGKVSVGADGSMTVNGWSNVVTSPDQSVKTVIKITKEDFDALVAANKLVVGRAYDIVDPSGSIEPGGGGAYGDFLPLEGGDMTGDINWIDEEALAEHGLYWKEKTTLDSFKIIPKFNGTEDANVLALQGTTTTNSTLGDLVTVSAASGNMVVKGTVTARSFGGNATSATKLANKRTINISDATGTNTGTGIDFDGSAAGTIKLPAKIKAELDGNAATATKATSADTATTATSAGKLTTARSINVSDSTGAHTGTAISFDGSSGGTIKLPASITASLVGNADTATKLKASVNINGKAFDGSKSITIDTVTTQATSGGLTAELPLDL